MSEFFCDECDPRGEWGKHASDCESRLSPPEVDMINSPPHYKGNGIEAIDVIEAFGLGYHLGTVAKYLLRAGKKGDRLEDLKKARWFLEREISRLEDGK